MELIEDRPSMTTQSAARLKTTEVSKKSKQKTLEQTQRTWGWIFLSPWIFGFLAFTAFPMLASLYFSFTNFTTGQPIQWVGLTNWKNLFADPTTLGSLFITLRFGLYLVPVSLLFPLLLATLLNSKALLGKPVLRTL